MDPIADVAAAVNNRDVLANCLNRSPDIAGGRLRLRTYEGYACASRAYNQALDDSDAEIVVLPHQDVYLPRGFEAQLNAQIAQLNRLDPNWAIAGAIGQDRTDEIQGYTWCTGVGRELGRRLSRPAVVETLDEMLLVVRRASGLRFDPELPSFHLYAADAIQIAKAAGMKSYALDLPVVHHSRPVVNLDDSYKAAYRYMQRKWRAVLPIPNLVCPIERLPFRLLVRDAQIRWWRRGMVRPEGPKDDPSLIAARLELE